GIAARHFALPRRDRAADLDAGLANETMNDLVAIVVLDQLILAALRIGTLNGKDHVSIADWGLQNIYITICTILNPQSAIRNPQFLLNLQVAHISCFAGDLLFREAAGAVNFSAGHLAAGHVQGHDVDETVVAAPAAHLDRRVLR